MIYHAKTQ